MGQKVSPIGFRVGVIRDWESRWYADKEYGTLLQEDIKIREMIEKKCKDCMVSHIEIERFKSRVEVMIRTARPGLFVGQDGALIQDIKKTLEKATGKSININVVEVLNPDLDARLVAMKIAKMLEERQSFRTAQKKAIQATMRAGAKGIKTAVSGRLGGADIARTEGYSEGVTPLHTLRSDIDYAWEEAMTTYGKLGVKVWICRGEVLPGEMVKEPERPKGMRGNDRRNDRRRNNFRRNNRNTEAQAVNTEASVENQAPSTEEASAEKGGN